MPNLRLVPACSRTQDGRSRRCSSDGYVVRYLNGGVHPNDGDSAMSIGTILLIILVIVLLGGFSGFGGGPFYGTGYYGGGGLGLIIVILLILVLLGRL